MKDPHLRALCAAILIRAAKDYQRGTRPDQHALKGDAGIEQAETRYAKVIAFWHSEWCDTLCTYIDIEAAYLRRKLFAGECDGAALRAGAARRVTGDS